MTTEKCIPLHILEAITNGFSADSIIGTGGYGNVYKGVYNGREIAVKLLHVDTVQGLDDQHFKNEVGNLLSVKHPNIVQLLGYCYETKKIFVERNGVNDFSERIYRVICFEYLQGGSLDKHLYGKSFAPNWSTRYNIIKGVCEGLNFLHKCEPQILHLDLKPANILLDSSMEPKVADLGLSRLFTQSHTQVTERIIGSRKYMPPEFINGGKISPKNDVFSFGVVMIEIMTTSLGYSNSSDVDDVALFKQLAFTSWSTVIEATSKYRSDELYQVQTCIELAIRCVDSERDNRPTTADILDALNKTEANIPKRQVADELPCPTIRPKNSMDNTLKMMIAELENITSEHNCNSTPRDSFNNNVQQATDSRETSSYVDEALVIGRTEEKQKIVATLSGSVTPELSILPIYGIGGIGKTTLARLVFNDSQFADHSRVWVYVSQNLDLQKIGNSIISQLSEKEESPATIKQIIQNRLSKLLSGKKILIVLDDVWEKNPDTLETLIDMLRLGVGSKVKIIVTTRDEAIAREICHTIEPYKLEPFSDKICWKIIKQKAAFNRRVDKKHLKQIGREIATKCGGVALAAQSLGYMLKPMKHCDEWKSVRDSYIWNLSTSQGPSSGNHIVLASLLLSYTHMPDWLKLCFTYCAVLPKGHLIEKYSLIHQWIALGFTEQCSPFDPMQLCEAYVTQLLEMSFLQYTMRQPSSNQWQDKGVTSFTMHDLVHDLARALLAHQVNDKGSAGGDRCRYALLTDCSKPLQLSVTCPSNIKVLRFMDCGKLELHGNAFSLAICLHVLDLSECFIRELPDSIGQLKQLRFLCAPRIQDQMIPNWITELSELSYLNLRGSRKISALPDSIGDMKGMMHLDLSGCRGIRELPASFAELKQLVHLDLSQCPVSISEAFGGFTELQYLNLCAGFIERPNSTGFSKVIGNLIKLRYLNLCRCMEFMATSEDQMARLLGSISTLFNLEHLDLSINGFSKIPESFGDLKKLHTLNISVCENLQKLPDSMVNMVSLKFLTVNDCPKLDKSALSMPNVVSLPYFFVHADSDKCNSNIIHLQPTNPYELTIDGLQNVKSAEEAQSIKLMEKQNIEVLTLQWTKDVERFVDDKEVLEKLVPPSSVRQLTISCYESVRFPDWPMGIGQFLPNLSEIYLYGFPNYNNLPPLGQLPNLQKLTLDRMDGLEEWDTAYTSGEEGVNEFLFPELEYLTILHCPKLRRLSVQHYSMFPKLEELNIHYCANLRIEPCLPRAKELEVRWCDNVLSSWEESPSHRGASSSSPITTLEVRESRLPLHQWRLLHHLPALRCLTITSCSDLTASREIIKCLSSLQSLHLWSNYEEKAELLSWLAELTSLQELTLYQCFNMTLVPQWVGKLASLKKLRILFCSEIRSLPDSIQQLSNLEHLQIRGCPILKEWCQSEENKIKLAHIRQVGHLRHTKQTFIETANNVDTEENICLIDEVPTDPLYSAVMNMPGFTEEQLLVALSHLMDNRAQGSAYMGMQEQGRVSWLINFLKKHY